MNTQTKTNSRSTCDKCGREVPRVNNAVDLAIFYGEFSAVGAQSRHLLPVIEDGVVVCEGSPSRAQFLEGQPRDTRGYSYLSKWEPRIRLAYARLIAEFGKEDWPRWTAVVVVAITDGNLPKAAHMLSMCGRHDHGWDEECEAGHTAMYSHPLVLEHAKALWCLIKPDVAKGCLNYCRREVREAGWRI